MLVHPTYREPEPLVAELAAIEAEWPVIAAELDLVEAECRLAVSPADVLAGRAYRRAVHQLLAVVVSSTAPVTAPAMVSGVVPDAA